MKNRRWLYFYNHNLKYEKTNNRNVRGPIPNYWRKVLSNYHLEIMVVNCHLIHLVLKKKVDKSYKNEQTILWLKVIHYRTTYFKVIWKNWQTSNTDHTEMWLVLIFVTYFANTENFLLGPNILNWQTWKTIIKSAFKEKN